MFLWDTGEFPPHITFLAFLERDIHTPLNTNKVGNTSEDAWACECQGHRER